GCQSGGPASRRQTLWRPSAVRRLARMQPAEPAPTINEVEGVRHHAAPARFAQRPELRLRMSHAGAPGGRNPAHLLGATGYAVGVLSGWATADHLAPLADAVVPNIHALNIVGV